jgi:acetyltransferase-like isoleucine patch superfamily enzyme
MLGKVLMSFLKKIGIIAIAVSVFLVIGFFYPALYEIVGAFFYSVFNEWISWIYLTITVSFVTGGWIFGLGFAYMKRNYLRGYLSNLLGALLMFFCVFSLITYTFFTLIFTSLLSLEIKLILVFTFALASGPFLIICLEKIFDLHTFFKDIWSQRADYYKLSYTIEEKGNLTYVHIQKNDSNIENIIEAAPSLKIQEIMHIIRKNPDVSLAFYVKSAILFIVTEIVRHLTAWPRARNRILHKFARMKIGKDVSISQWTRIDPLFPDLIEFEDGSGVGIGCQLLTHNFIEKDPLSISFGPIRIGKNARVGAFSTILPGVTIGEGAIVGTGSIVADDIPPYTIAYGTPACVVKTIEGKPEKVVIEKFKS